MAKHLKITTKNEQIAQAINMGSLKDKLKKKKGKEKDSSPSEDAVVGEKHESVDEELTPPEKKPKARSHSVFSETSSVEEEKLTPASQEPVLQEKIEDTPKPFLKEEVEVKPPQEDVSPEVTVKEAVIKTPPVEKAPAPQEYAKKRVDKAPYPAHSRDAQNKSHAPSHQKSFSKEKDKKRPPRIPERMPLTNSVFERKMPPRETIERLQQSQGREKLGPTGRHVKDLERPKRPVAPPAEKGVVAKPPFKQPFSKGRPSSDTSSAKVLPDPEKAMQKEKWDQEKLKTKKQDEDENNKKKKVFVKGSKEGKPSRKGGFGDSGDGDDFSWKRRKNAKFRSFIQEEVVQRPTSITITLPITVKDLAQALKLKASEIIGKLLLQGIPLTLNDVLSDATMIQLLGLEFGCEIIVDTRREEKIKITDKTIKEEIGSTIEENRKLRPPVVAFMGHVDHGKTSLIDKIRSSNVAATEAGAITQHIGAFQAHTKVGTITILDTPGHEAFSAMRARGADVTDIVVLVVAGDEGMKQQTIEALQHAKAAGVTIIVAINKCDKPGFDPETVYRQLSEHELLPEAWGGQTITVNCSAQTGEGIEALVEMLALQAEVLELYADPSTRARGSVLESEMHKGLGAISTVLIQNGTLRCGDCLVFNDSWARIKVMRDHLGNSIQEAGPSKPVSIIGLSGLPKAGHEFIVVSSEKEAREIAEARQQDLKEIRQHKPRNLESLLQQSGSNKKVLNIILRADVQGSLEALRHTLERIDSQKVEVNIISHGVGEISESDIHLAAASKALVLGFHTSIERHAESLIKEHGVDVRLHDIIYHAVDDVKDAMKGQLDKVAQENQRGKAEIRAIFKVTSSAAIVGCYVLDGTISRGNHARIKRNGAVVWSGNLSGLRRVKDDVREVSKGYECGMMLNQCPDPQEGDIIETYEIVYLTQTL